MLNIKSVEKDVYNVIKIIFQINPVLLNFLFFQKILNKMYLDKKY